MATSEGDQLEFVLLQEIPQPKGGTPSTASTTASTKGPRPLDKSVPGLGEEHCLAQKLYKTISSSKPGRRLIGEAQVYYFDNEMSMDRTPSRPMEGAAELLRNWMVSMTPLRGLHRIICGGDFNETLVMGDGDGVFGGTTARGELVASFLQELGLRAAEENWTEPTYHPYNRAMQSRRLDYIFVKGVIVVAAGVATGSRHEISSDHDAVELQLVQLPHNADHRPRRLRTGVPVQPDKAKELLRKRQPPRVGEGFLLGAVAELSQRLIAPKSSKRFQESQHLIRLRHAAQQARGGAARTLWKEVHSVRKSEKRKWLKHLTFWATRGDWGAWKKLFGMGPRTLWEPALIQRYVDWPTSMTEHMEAIFFRDSQAENEEARDETRLQLAMLPGEYHAFSMEEVHSVMAKWKSGRAAGPDGITYEALRIILKDDAWGAFVLEELNEFLKLGFTTSDLYSTSTFMLAKKREPREWGDLRPITLSSALLKLLSQLTLKRVTHLLGTANDLQWAAPSKQPLELALGLGRMLRLCREWKQEAFLVKIDVRKAFDSVKLPRLLRLIRRKLAGRPKEGRLLTEMVCHLGINVEFLDQHIPIRQSNGVKQGAPESPVLFAALIAELADEVATEFGMALPHEEPGWELPFNLAAFADDMYLWHFCLRRLQELLTMVENKAAENGLQFQGDKTSVLTSVEDDARTLTIGGKQVKFLPPGSLVRVLGTQQGFKRGAADVAAEVNAKMRQVFWAHKAVFAGRMPLTCKWEAFHAVVRGSGLWQAAALPPSRNLLAALNTQQLRFVRVMAGLRRKQGEPFVDYEMRSLRVSRARLHLHGQERYSTYVLRQAWRLFGHVARQNSRAKQLLRWRGPVWWKLEQRKRGGHRHPGRYNAGMEIQNDFNTFLGVDDWMDVAQDRQRWKSLEVPWVKSQDLPWCTHAQAALEAEAGEQDDVRLAAQLRIQNLMPNRKKRQRKKSGAKATKRRVKQRPAAAQPAQLMLPYEGPLGQPKGGL
ncbi:jockey\pol [Symbiodinium natans]|uniref:Jockey\pol protein n=1 Tax=Symbiodinium natans TaxID=878477 RepID=A0A812TZR7_9DINO|nr:jockey\pol [Symbiodinium natans]